MSGRPPVSVIVPFRGELAEGQALVGSLRSLALGDGDEVIVADNTDDGAMPPDPGIEAVAVLSLIHI